MTKEHILSEIKRTASENDGVPLGIDRFREATGIKKEDWYGRYWTKWTEAQVEAGFQPNQFSLPAFEEEWLVERLIEYTRELGHFPTQPELRIKRHNDSEFPNTTTLRNRLGNKLQKIESVLGYCKAHEGYDDIIEMCMPDYESLKEKEVEESRGSSQEQKEEIGHVYLLKHDKVYKIGKSIDAARRYKEIKTQMPFKTEEIHVIETDDPSGIEAYWHNRFKDKRLEGEWFELSAQDIKAFKKRKFM